MISIKAPPKNLFLGGSSYRTRSDDVEIARGDVAAGKCVLFIQEVAQAHLQFLQACRPAVIFLHGKLRYCH